LVDVQEPRHRRLWLAGIEKLERLLLLVLGELARSAKADAGFPGAPNSDVCARLDQAALELGETAQDGQHQAAVRRRGVGPRIVQAFEQRALLANPIVGSSTLVRFEHDPLHALMLGRPETRSYQRGKTLTAIAISMDGNLTGVTSLLDAASLTTKRIAK